MDVQRRAILDYAERDGDGAPDVVFARAVEAAALPDAYVSSGDTGRVRASSAFSVVFVALVVVAMFGGAVWLAAGLKGTNTQSVGAPSVQAQPSEGGVTPSDHWARFSAGQWTEFRGTSAIAGREAPVGWIRVIPSADALRSAYTDGVPVYDRPDGAVVGYEFASLGFVPKDIVDQPGFDAEVLRAQASSTSTAG